MSETPKKGMNQENISTPERKKEYIKRWLVENPLPDACSTVDSNEFTPDVPSTSSNQCHKKLFSSTPPQSPSLGEKRCASSPVLGGMRRSFKRMKAIPKIAKFVDEKPGCSKEIFKKSSKKDSKQGKNCDVHILEKTKLSELQDTFKILETKQHIEPHSTQFIEPVSSDSETENTEPPVQEAASDTDKTASDLIEEINSQIIYESPEKPKKTLLSQKISTPSSTSSEQTNDDHITDSNTDLQITEILTPADQIDSISTQSKGESSKISYILQYTFEKPFKKKNPKKGSLSELLLSTMAKERSSVNLLRHQVYRNPLGTAEMPFILLQIFNHLPSFNGNQFLQCALIQDTTGLLKDFVNKKANYITVMNVPELSSTVNVNQKPILKVYEPWTVIDLKQLLIHITRFIAIPSTKEEFDFQNINNKVLKLSEEFHCPCVDKNVISNECNSKFCDSDAKSSVKMICNYVP